MKSGKERIYKDNPHELNELLGVIDERLLKYPTFYDHPEKQKILIQRENIVCRIKTFKELTKNNSQSSSSFK